MWPEINVPLCNDCHRNLFIGKLGGGIGFGIRPLTLFFSVH